MEELFYQKIGDAVVQFADSIEWLFVLVFMVFTWLFLEAVYYFFNKNKFNKALVTVVVLFIGVALAIGYAYIYEKGSKVDIANLFYSVLTGMVIYKMGVDKLFEALKNKWKVKP